MFSRFVYAFFVVIAMIIFSTAAFAGKTELTTYYPSPTGEYSSVKASGKLKIPAKTVTSTTGLSRGEIWADPCFAHAGTRWNGSACVV